MKNDVIQVEILEDGTLKFTTDPISGSNHANAEEALRFIARMAGGETTRVKRSDVHHAHGHHHHHGEGDHDHEHN